MACMLDLWCMVFNLLLVLKLLHGKPQVPCFFIFGDSLNDNGNNNLNAILRVNYLPYGIDFPKGPTGRFCNGRTYADVIAELLGFDDYIPSHATARGKDILKGVNYASAGGGIRDETGQAAGIADPFSFNDQLKFHINTVSQVANILGDKDFASNYLSKCIYLVQVGGNDYLDNYFVPQAFLTSQEYTPEQYADVLIEQYSKQLKILYKYKARKVIVVGVGQVGCIPYCLAKNSSDGSSCVKKINSAVEIFNDKLGPLVEDFNNDLADAKFIYVNYSGISKDIMTNPSMYGFKVRNKACCGGGRNKGQIICLPLQFPCQNRSEYVFWDSFHPTEATNLIIGRRSYSAESPSDAYPIDIQHLAQF